MEKRVLESLTQIRQALDRLIASQALQGVIERAGMLLIETFQSQGRVFSCGNGGSMCEAMHFAEELSGRFRRERPGLPAMAISDPGHLSCVANDYGYDQVFARFLEAHGRSGDCLLALSTSGSSANVLKAAETARRMSLRVITLTGRENSPLSRLADVDIALPGGAYADRSQELHLMVIHILIESIERRLFPENY
ncbi:MAG: SIS domain-containing protein [Desulfobacterales bacterium]|jgi:D-sedoheptulose 7-phosphate isomerase